MMTTLMIMKMVMMALAMMPKMVMMRMIHDYGEDDDNEENEYSKGVF